jgi:hypothetical protein
VLVELGPGDADGSVEIIIGQGRGEAFVAVVFQVRRPQATRRRLPAAEEEDYFANAVPAVSEDVFSVWRPA